LDPSQGLIPGVTDVAIGIFNRFTWLLGEQASTRLPTLFAKPVSDLGVSLPLYLDGV